MKKTTLALLISLGLASTVALAGQVVHVVKPGEKDFNNSWTLDQTIKSVQVQTSIIAPTVVYIGVSSVSAPMQPTPDSINVVCGKLPPVVVGPGSSYTCFLGTEYNNPSNLVSWTDAGSNGSNGTYTIN